jgi:hypothetical protein
MGMEYLGDLIAEIRKARADLDGIIDNRDQRYIKRFDALEGSINEFYKKLNRPVLRARARTLTRARMRLITAS